jgi:hypothetical protein
VSHRPAKRPVKVHAVSKEPVVPRDGFEPLPRRLIDTVLTNVDVHARAEIGRKPSHSFEGGLTKGETGVSPHQAPPARAQEAFVLGKSGTHTVGAVAVGDFITTKRSDADLGTSVRYDA